jgi:SAM-dependent methyltransferase
VTRLPPLALNAWMRYDAIRRAFTVVPAGAHVLEIGAGQGGLGARLARRYVYTGIEPDRESARVAQPRIEAQRGRFLAIPASELPAEERFHAIAAFEVLEHIEDDVQALETWCRHLLPGGWLILSVPAFQRRFAAADQMVGHFRRYDPEVLRARLTAVGLIEHELWVTGFPFGLLLERGRNIMAARRPKAGAMAMRTLESGRWHQPPEILGPVTQAITLPFRWLQRPFARTRLGTGLVARARLPAPARTQP